MDRVRGVCHHAGISRPEFDLTPFALYNALEASAGFLNSGCELLLDVGADTARAILLIEGNLRCVGIVKARRLMTFANGTGARIADGGEAEVPAGGQFTPPELPLDDFDEWMDTLARGAEKLVRAELGELHIDRCWLSGRHAVQAQESLSRRLGLGAQLLDPFSRIDTGMQELDDPTVFATAAGLALRGISES
jgi:hypothetical protein